MKLFSTPFLSLCRALIVPVGMLALIITTGCGASNSPMMQAEGGPSVVDAAANVAAGGSVPKVLLFVGTGTTSGSVAGYKTILGDLKLTYAI